jgi:hypothetical protein
VASKCYLLITPTTLLLFIPTVQAITIHRYVKMAGGQEERPPSPKCDGGHQQRGRPVAGHRPLPSPVALELAPHPRDPVPVPAADSAAFIFLPPTLSLVHPALHLPAWILILLLTPASNSVSLLTAAYPFPPNGDNHVTCRQSTAGRGPPSLCRRHPRHPEQGGGGAAEHSALSLPESCRRLVR